MHNTSKLPCSPGKCHAAVLCAGSLKSVLLVDLCLVLLVLIVGIRVVQYCAFVSSCSLLSLGFCSPFCRSSDRFRPFRSLPGHYIIDLRWQNPQGCTPSKSWDCTEEWNCISTLQLLFLRAEWKTAFPLSTVE